MKPWPPMLAVVAVLLMRRLLQRLHQRHQQPLLHRQRPPA